MSGAHVLTGADLPDHGGRRAACVMVDRASPPPRRADRVIGCLVRTAPLLLVIAVCACRAPDASSGQKPAAEASALAAGAKAACDDTVQAGLKARLGTGWTVTMHVAGMTVEDVSDLGGGRWLVRGNYDLQKADESVKHQSYHCEMEYLGAGRFAVRRRGVTLVIQRPRGRAPAGR